MADILEEIVAHKRIEIEQRKRFIQPRQMITLTELHLVHAVVYEHLEVVYLDNLLPEVWEY